jgi:ribosomal-protein-alanine N-acetyltransferase
MNKSQLSLFKKIPTVTTERLILRKMLPTDADDMFEYAQNPIVTQFLLWEPHVTRKFTQSYLKFIQSQYAGAMFFDWAVTLADSGKMIGTCGFARLDLPNRVGEIGYVLNPDFRARGIAVEAARAVIDFGFKNLALHRIEARFMQGNDASRRVMEKLGMSFEGFAKDSIFVKGAYRTVGTCSLINPFEENNY